MPTRTPAAPPATEFVRSFEELTHSDVAFAGGKGANLGELTSAGFDVPSGFVVGASAYATFCEVGGLRDQVGAVLEGIDVDDSDELQAASERARALVREAPVPQPLVVAIEDAYAALGEDGGDVMVAVRSSATAEDTASASFAGMNETFLNVTGADGVLDAVRRCWASLFGGRTVFYRAKRGFGHADMDIAVVVQRQIASVTAGVMFTVDPSTGESGNLVIEGSFGLGEAVVSGQVSPDRFVVDKATRSIAERGIRRKELVIEPKPGGGTVTRELSEHEGARPVLADEQVGELAAIGIAIEEHYGSPQDTEWALDTDGRIWVLQSRPVTTLAEPGATPKAEPAGEVLVRGLGAAPGRASGPVKVIRSLGESAELQAGDVLVTHMTSPDWVPLMRRASAVVTDSGGMTCHAAIVTRELGVPCIVGTADATGKLRAGEIVGVDATHGIVFAGALPPEPVGAEPSAVAAPAEVAPVTATKILVNLSEPSQVEQAARLPVEGVGLLRAEMMVLEALEGVHPRLLIEQGRRDEFVDRMAAGLETFAAGFAPRPITYRTIDFRTNEFRGLEGGDRFEPQESNPMIGYRGALRYTREPELLGLELDAIRRVWDAGHENLHVMLPFVRTAHELEICRGLFVEAGLLDLPGFELWVMAEVPSVLFNLERYRELGIAGISIGSNDLTQLLLGADRDSELLAGTFDERDPAVAAYLRELIPRARGLGLATSICGQAPSVHPEYAQLLVECGIDAISVTADAVARVRRNVAAAEQRLILAAAR